MANGGDSKSGIIGFLNSPFVITVFGGVVLALLGAIFQSHYTQIENDRAYVRIAREKKYELMRAFAADLDSQIRYKIFLNNEQPGDSGSPLALQRLHDYQEVLLMNLKTPQASTYRGQITTTFESGAVRDALKTFLTSLRNVDGVIDRLVKVRTLAIDDTGKTAKALTPDEAAKASAWRAEEVKKGRSIKPATDLTPYMSADIEAELSGPRDALFKAMQEDIKSTKPDS